MWISTWASVCGSKKQRVRLYGIDTPESRTRDLVEKKFGKMAGAHLKARLSKGAILGTRLDSKGKYGKDTW